MIGSTEERGAVATLVSVLISALLGCTALAADVALIRWERQRIQAAVDSGALAGANKILAGVGNKAAIEAEARALTTENLPDGVILALEVGRYESGQFIANAPGLPNAVRVVAAKAVPAFFARIWGSVQTIPRASAIAAVGPSENVTCAIPFGIDDNVLHGKNYGSTINVNRSSAGNWGKLDIDGNMSSQPAFVSAMTNGICSKSIRVGDEFTPGTGFGGVQEGFEQRLQRDPLVIIPIVNAFPSGNSARARVVGFIVGKLLTQNGRGGTNWNGEIEFVNVPAGTGVAGSVGAPYAPARVLVQ